LFYDPKYAGAFLPSCVDPARSKGVVPHHSALIVVCLHNLMGSLAARLARYSAMGALSLAALLLRASPSQNI
jgi:hypothetical protein